MLARNESSLECLCVYRKRNWVMSVVQVFSNAGSLVQFITVEMLYSVKIPQ